MNPLFARTLLAGLFASAGAAGFAFPAPRIPREPKRYPGMVTASREEIAEHNRNVRTRQVSRATARAVSKTLR